MRQAIQRRVPVPVTVGQRCGRNDLLNLTRGSRLQKLIKPYCEEFGPFSAYAALTYGHHAVAQRVARPSPDSQRVIVSLVRHSRGFLASPDGPRRIPWDN
jgi:hypothetical protein